MFGKKINKETDHNNDNVLRDYDVHYNGIMRSANLRLKKMSKEEQLIYLEYLIRVILVDVCSSRVVLPMKNGGYIKPISQPFPYYYYDENGEICNISTNEKQIVSLADDMIYISVWSDKKISKSILHLYKNDFKFNEAEHQAIFYTDIDLCYVHNGNHSINAGRYYKKGEIISKVYNTELLYPHYITDGEYWYNRHNTKKKDKVSDFRLAAVYSLAQIRYFVKNNMDIEVLRLELTKLCLSLVYDGNITEIAAMNRLNITPSEFKKMFEEYKKNL